MGRRNGRSRVRAGRADTPTHSEKDETRELATRFEGWLHDERRRRLRAPFNGSVKSDKDASGVRAASPPPPDTPAKPKAKKDDTFYRTWDRFLGKQHQEELHALVLRQSTPGLPPVPLTGPDGARDNAARSYDDAAALCERHVDAVIKECRRLNRKYFDPTFQLQYSDALVSLAGYHDRKFPSSTTAVAGGLKARRVTEIFGKPQFFIDGATAQDVRQGHAGDCWFLAAVMALAGKKGLLERICVKRDEECGVYGFVFFRDGEWVSEIVDDLLYVRHHEDSNLQLVYGPSGAEIRAKLPKKLADEIRRGADNLFFGKCMDSDETWLPLLEKAYAKAHGSYQSIDGGWPGEAIEDLTGGVNTCLQSDEILDKGRLWSELKKVNVDFLFGCASREGLDRPGTDEQGLVRGHAYTVLEAREFKGERLLKIRNPWGWQEWNGAWSDGSKEWDGEAIRHLMHTFGDDGIFWIKFEDFLQNYPVIDRTRLFGPEWTIAQQWMSSTVPRSISHVDSAYLARKAHLKLTKPGPVVIVLCQPDARYFQGLEGRFSFNLHFRLAKSGEEDFILRSISDTESQRSCNAEVDLEVGEYDIYIKVTPSREDEASTAAEVINAQCKQYRKKILSTGKEFDSAHAKGMLRERELEADQEEKAKKKSENLERLKAQKSLNVATRKRDKLRSHRSRDAEERKKEVKRREREQKKKGGKADKEPESPGDGAGGEAGTDALGSDDEDGTTVSSVADDDFGWDSNIDAPMEGGDLSNGSEPEEVEGMPDVDKWKAICVVGLRVYSQDAAAQVELDAH